MAEQLPITGWESIDGYTITAERLAHSPDYLKGAWDRIEKHALTPHTPAQSALDELRREVERLTEALKVYEKVGSNSMRMANETVERMIAAEAEVEALRADAERYRWLRKNACSYSDGYDGPELAMRTHGPDWKDEIDTAIDTARASTDEGVGK